MSPAAGMPPFLRVPLRGGPGPPGGPRSPRFGPPNLRSPYRPGGGPPFRGGRPPFPFRPGGMPPMRGSSPPPGVLRRPSLDRAPSNPMFEKIGTGGSRRGTSIESPSPLTPLDEELVPTPPDPYPQPPKVQQDGLDSTPFNHGSLEDRDPEIPDPWAGYESPPAGASEVIHETSIVATMLDAADSRSNPPPTTTTSPPSQLHNDLAEQSWVTEINGHKYFLLHGKYSHKTKAYYYILS